MERRVQRNVGKGQPVSHEIVAPLEQAIPARERIDETSFGRVELLEIGLRLEPRFGHRRTEVRHELGRHPRR